MCVLDGIGFRPWTDFLTNPSPRISMDEGLGCVVALALNFVLAEDTQRRGHSRPIACHPAIYLSFDLVTPESQSDFFVLSVFFAWSLLNFAPPRGGG